MRCVPCVCCTPHPTPENHIASVTEGTVPGSSWRPQDVPPDFLLSELLFLAAQSVGRWGDTGGKEGKGRTPWGSVPLPGVTLLFLALRSEYSV